MKLVGVIKCHLLNTLGSGITNIRVGLAGLGVDNSARVDLHAEDLFNFSLRGTIKAGTKLRQKANNLRVRIALDGYSDISSCA